MVCLEFILVLLVKMKDNDEGKCFNLFVISCGFYFVIL